MPGTHDRVPGFVLLSLVCYETERGVNSEKGAQKHMHMFPHMHSISQFIFPQYFTLICTYLSY